MMFSFYFVAFTDEEKVDERAKLSVAAKRLLFRVRRAKWFCLETTVAPGPGTSHPSQSLRALLDCSTCSLPTLSQSGPFTVAEDKVSTSFTFQHTASEALLCEQLALCLGWGSTLRQEQVVEEAAHHLEGGVRKRKRQTSGSFSEG